MRRMYPILLVLSLFVVTVSRAQIGTSQRPIGGKPAQSGASSGIWIVLAPHILVSFTQLALNTCTWAFRNSDNFRILESMHFSYTDSSIPLNRAPVSGSVLKLTKTRSRNLQAFNKKLAARARTA